MGIFQTCLILKGNKCTANLKPCVDPLNYLTVIPPDASYLSNSLQHCSFTSPIYTHPGLNTGLPKI